MEALPVQNYVGRCKSREIRAIFPDSVWARLRMNWQTGLIEQEQGESAMENTTWSPHLDATRCTNCGECVLVCPTHVFGTRGDRVTVIDPDACTYCGLCEPACPVNAIDLPYQIVLEEESRAR